MTLTATEIYAVTNAAIDREIDAMANEMLKEWERDNTPPWWVWACSFAVAAVVAVALAIPTAYALDAVLVRLVGS